MSLTPFRCDGVKYFTNGYQILENTPNLVTMSFIMKILMITHATHGFDPLLCQNSISRKTD